MSDRRSLGERWSCRPATHPYNAGQQVVCDRLVVSCVTVSVLSCLEFVVLRNCVRSFVVGRVLRPSDQREKIMASEASGKERGGLGAPHEIKGTAVIRYGASAVPKTQDTGAFERQILLPTQYMQTDGTHDPPSLANWIHSTQRLKHQHHTLNAKTLYSQGVDIPC